VRRGSTQGGKGTATADGPFGPITALAPAPERLRLGLLRSRRLLLLLLVVVVLVVVVVIVVIIVVIVCKRGGMWDKDQLVG
jgi:hypothetical protein